MPHSWELRSYEDVSRALLDERLRAHGEGLGDRHAHQDVRAAVRDAHTPRDVTSWIEPLRAHAQLLLNALPNDEPVDLVADFAVPWSLEMAHVVTGAGRSRDREMFALARQLFLAAASATDGAPTERATDAARDLSSMLSHTSGEYQASATVQTYVAITHSLPALLAGAWLELLRDSHALEVLLADKTLIMRAVGELLRLGSPSRVVFREAVDDTRVGDSVIARGDRIALNLWQANRDATRFPEPDRIDLARESSALLTFGMGRHHCPGSALVRASTIAATEALLTRDRTIELAGDEASAVDWMGGYAIRAPARLSVVLRARR